MSVTQAPSGAQEDAKALYLAVLSEHLAPIESFVTQELDRVRSRAQDERMRAAECNAQVQSLQGKLKADQRSVDDLDTEELLQLEAATGELRQEHQKRRLHMTPDFHFSVTTDVPIREWRTETGPHSKWTDVRCARGQRYFQGQVKNASFKSASASILLLGWKRDVRASELAEARAALSQTEEHLKEATTVQGLATIVVKATESSLEKLEERLKVCRSDRQALQRSADEFTPQMMAACDAQSISAFATAIGMLSAVARRAEHNNLMDSYCASFFGWIQEGHRAAVDGLTKLDKCLASAKEDVVSRHGKTGRNSAMRSDLKHKQVNTLICDVEAKEDYEKLKEELAKFFERQPVDWLKAKLGELEALQEAVPKAPGEEQSREALVLLRNNLAQDIQSVELKCMAAAATIENGRSDECGIGSHAALSAATGRLDGWMSIYRGHLSEL